jgi:nucleoside-diphosphate-sugar epimerase
LAAIVGYPACKANIKNANEVNYIGTKKLVKNCKVPIIFASSGSCYGHVENICTEETPLKPLTEYAKTKILAEKEIKKASDYIILRFSTGFGLSLRQRFDLLINDFVIRAVQNKELIIYEKDYWRTFIHVKDMVRCYLFALDNFEKLNQGIYNVGSESLCLTKEQVARKIKKYVDFYLKFAEFGSDPDKRNYKVSFEKIRNCGFKTKYDLDYGIIEMKKAAEIMKPNEKYYNSRMFA